MSRITGQQKVRVTPNVLTRVTLVQHRAAEERLLVMHGTAVQVRDVHVRLHVLDRRIQLAFLPCFHLEYEHGESFNAHGERVPAWHEAIISGTGKMGWGWQAAFSLFCLPVSLSCSACVVVHLPP